MRYELIREIFNLCSNNQMRDVFVSEVETSDPEAVARTYCPVRTSRWTARTTKTAALYSTWWRTACISA